MTAITMDRFVTLLRGRPAKQIARLARVHPRTATRWQAGESVPSADDLIRLMAGDAGIFAEIAALAGRADEARRARAQQLLGEALRELGG